MARETPDKNPDLHALRHEVDATRSRLLNGLLVVFGTVFVALGVLGVLLPIVPTTPFLLLAAFCYAHSSERFYLWLLTNRFFGNYIRDWREKKGFTVRVKIWIVFVMGSTMGASIYFVPIAFVRVLLVVIGFGVAIYIWRLPTKGENALKEDAT